MKVGDIHTEELVVEKAREMLIKYGVKGWNMNDLARESNMSKRTLYKIIGSKEDLLFKILLNNMKNEIARLKKYLQSDKSFPELLNNLSQQITDGFDDFILSNIKAIRIEYPKIKEREEKFIADQGQFITLFFQKGKDEGCIREDLDVGALVIIVKSLIEYQMITCNNKTDFKTEMGIVLSTFFTCILK
ncbi:TetR/AcrR family transcriptional regulator [bacterium]|nr:TetR/AcrR family transcriptional regulator [bacterium]